MEQKKNMKKILFGKPEGKRPLSIRKFRRKDYIKMDLKGTMREVVGWIHLVEDSVQSRMNSAPRT
jgi:hypothetical protein